MSRKPCPSTLTAPFKGEDAEHQCAGLNDHDGQHFCGCGYEWNNAGSIVTWADKLIREAR